MYKFSEYVSPGHPDKVADYISEYILDRYVEVDPNVRYAVEVMIKGFSVYIAGEITSTVNLEKNMLRYVKEAINEIGYTPEYAEKWGFDNVINSEGIVVYTNITAQSPEIGQGVNNDGWGDQGVFFGYADPDGDEFMMPKSHSLAKNLCFMLYSQAKDEGIGGLDIKTEIILDTSNGWIEKIIAAVPCRSDEEYQTILQSIKDWYNETETDIPFYPEIILNGTGNYVMHGPIADCGVTGRKLAVDFYGGEFQVGGGAPIKDGTKADVTLNLYARKLALKYSKKEGIPIKVSLACCIGQSDVNYSITNPCGDEIESGVIKLTPKKLIEELGLNKPIFASMNHFGLFGEFQQDKSWEK
jgi:S-adenosylmethionine synthetase